MPHPPSGNRRRSRPESPRTPSLGSPVASVFFSSNRKSSDSWNSIADDDSEASWSHDQLILLSRTLDAVPQNVLTPYTGAVPPSNLLDKLARGIVQAKGPNEWPHSVRQTRQKLVELARGTTVVPATIDENVESTTASLRDSTNIQMSPTRSRKRPLARASSMDFIQAANLDSQVDAFSKASGRLQEHNSIFPTPSHHHPLSPSTPSSTTLRSNGTSNTRYSRPTSQSSSIKTLSSMSSTSSYSCLPPVPRGFPRRSPLKRMSSYSAMAPRRDSISEDEEEVARAANAKKARPTPKRPMNARRNPSILGPELPMPTSPSKATPVNTDTADARTPPRRSRARPAPLNNPHPHLRVSIPTLEPSPAITARPLRRTPRRISFNAARPAEDSLLEGAIALHGVAGLESAFELR
ncbi:unnamed protein product [Peniophora sp. CBMAI 1063]|nr:unnamed protein product [Peniophora sp. CBMAI 1063]